MAESSTDSIPTISNGKMKSFLKKIHSLFKKDSDAAKGIIKASDAYMKRTRNNLKSKHPTETFKDLFAYLGSVPEGTLSARMYSEELFILEGDIILEVLSLPLDLVVSVGGKPGCYFLKKDKLLIQQLRNLGVLDVQDFLDNALASPGEYLEGFPLEKLSQRIIKFNDNDDKVRRSASSMLGFDKCRFTHENRIESHGPVMTNLLRLKLDDKDYVQFSIDVAAGARLQSWPPEAESWRYRARRWPSHEVIRKIIEENEVFIISNPGDHCSEWRICFLSEKRLAAERTDSMQFTYYLFKIIFLTFFNSEGEVLPSYIAKTTMMWACEEVDVPTWKERNLNLNLQYLLNKVFEYLDEGHIPHYFIPEMNLLDIASAGLVDRIRSKDRSSLLNDPLACVPTCFEKVSSQLELVKKSMSKVETYLQVKKAMTDVKDAKKDVKDAVSPFWKLGKEFFREVKRK